MVFYPEEIFKEIKATYCFADITENEWNEILYFITAGGNALQQYDEFKKLKSKMDFIKSIAGGLRCGTACISAPL